MELSWTGSNPTLLADVSKFESVLPFHHCVLCCVGCRRDQFLARFCSCCTLPNFYCSSRATVFVRTCMLTIHRCMSSVLQMKRSRYRSVSQHASIMSLNGDAFESSPVERSEDRGSLVTHQSSTLSAAAVVASCWYRSRCVHRRRPESRHFYWRWRIAENACNEDGIIMLRYPASTTVYSTFSAANRSSVAGVVTCPQSAGLW